MVQELRDPPSPAGLMRMASQDDSLWNRDQIGTDLKHSGPSFSRPRSSFTSQRSSRLGRAPSGGLEPPLNDEAAEPALDDKVDTALNGDREDGGAHIPVIRTRRQARNEAIQQKVLLRHNHMRRTTLAFTQSDQLEYGP